MQYNTVNSMKNVEIINRIIEIEASAQELIKNAGREQSELPLKISEILDAYKTQQHEKALDKIKNIRIAEEKSAEEKIERIRKEHEEKLGKLKRIVDENIDSWVEKIYCFIIKPTEI
ncbi:MAG: hypothetical protein FWF92_10185 [Oscillospiraceae bacterium]|nr:hypothetical protein [Oscillospiraceae bacterium]